MLMKAICDFDDKYIYYFIYVAEARKYFECNCLCKKKLRLFDRRTNKMDDTNSLLHQATSYLMIINSIDFSLEDFGEVSYVKS